MHSMNLIQLSIPKQLLFIFLNQLQLPQLSLTIMNEKTEKQQIKNEEQPHNQLNQQQQQPAVTENQNQMFKVSSSNNIDNNTKQKSQIILKKQQTSGTTQHNQSSSTIEKQFKQEIQPQQQQQVKSNNFIQQQQEEKVNICYYFLLNRQNIFKVNSRLRQFSEFLKNIQSQMDIENQPQQQQLQNFQIIIPSFIQVTQSQVDILDKFMKAFKQGENQTILTKIKNYDKDLSKHVSPQILKFIKENLSSLSHDDIKNLLKVCDFLRIKLLTELIHLFLSSKYAVPLSKSDLDRLFLSNNVPSYSRKDIINLKKQYFWFFKNLYSQNFSCSNNKNKNNES